MTMLLQPECFSVFDELWEEITDTADENNKIDYYDIWIAILCFCNAPNCHKIDAFR